MQLRDLMMQDLEHARYSESTRQAYLRCISNLAGFHWRDPAQLSQEDLRQWIRQLHKQNLSDSSMGVHYAALRFLYGKTLGKPEMVSFLSRRSLPQRLPQVLSADEVQRLLSALRTPRYRVFFTTIYATGMRIGEACLLRTDDIDAKRGVIVVRGKGNKERIVPLSPKLLAVLRAYWKKERPPAPWLFTSRKGGPLLKDAARMALKRAAGEAGIDKYVTPHVLRHSFATHLLDGGTELRIIQVLLGHENIETTTRYARVSSGTLAKVHSPFDHLADHG